MKMKGKKKRGISLIVLVITIIIMIILAAAIILSLTNSGIIGNAKEAVNKSDIATAKNAAAAAAGEWEILNEKGTAGLVSKKEYVENALIASGIIIGDKIIVTENGEVEQLSPIPNGFAYKEGTIKTGLVIEDITEEKTKGNEFVWVPVENINDFVRTAWSNNVPTAGLSADYKEPAEEVYIIGSEGEKTTLSLTNDLTNEHKEYAAMKASVEKNKGFYIARYETGKENIGGKDTAVSKKGKSLWNDIKWGDSMTNIGTTGAVYKSREMYEGSESVVSTLCYGVQYDAILNFVADTEHNVMNSSTWGNYNDYNSSVSQDKQVTGAGTRQVTGYSENWKSKNIYDFAGNIMEWTMESSLANHRLIRGGGSHNNGAAVPAVERGGDRPINSYSTTGFRVALYIK